MALTPKQERFCTEYITCGNASEAYRKAYDCARMKPETVNRNAFKLTNDNKIATRLQELRDKAAEGAVITLQSHLEDLKSLRDRAAAAEQYGAAITAEINRGKAAGLYETKVKGNMNVQETLTLELFSE